MGGGVRTPRNLGGSHPSPQPPPSRGGGEIGRLRHDNFSFARLIAMLRKEWLQMRRDPLTVALVVMLPLMQLFLFGFAINTNPHDLPTGVLSADHSQYERTLTSALQNTGYFDLRPFTSEAQAERGAGRRRGAVRAGHPAGLRALGGSRRTSLVLLDADATDPVAIGNATAAVAALNANVLARDLPPNMQTTPVQPPFKVVVHARYNPEQITALNIVPGLIGIILMLSTLVITTLSITREREAGTMENLLAMPVRPIEVMLGKIVPYVGLGYVQVLLILGVSTLVFQRAGARLGAGAAGGAGRVHCLQPGAGDHLLHPRADADAGAATGAVLAAAVDDAVGLHVPVPGHAGLGARDRRVAAADPRPAHLPRHPAEGQRLRRYPARRVADGVVRAGQGVVAVLSYRETLD